MSRLRKFVAAGIVVAFASRLTSDIQALAQPSDLDKQAWNYVWDRFEEVIGGNANSPLGPGEIVNILKFPIPLAYGVSAFSGATQLQAVAGVIPKRTFALDVSDQDIRLHDEYRRILANLEIPNISSDQQRKISSASNAYQTAFVNFDKAREVWSSRIISELKKLEVIGHKPTDQDYLRIRDATSGLISKPRSDMLTALANWKRELPVDFVLVEALEALEAATGGATDTLSYGIIRYELSEQVDFNNSQGCKESGWYELGVGRSTKSQSVRTDNWTAGGGWGGSFMKLGSQFGGGDFSNTVRTDTQSIKLAFCNMRFVTVSAPWLNMSLLRDIDRGLYKFKPGSMLAERKMLGPQGLIPRKVKGLVIARDIKLEARLDKTAIDEVRRSFSYQGGFSIGPFTFGGSASRVEYNITESGDSGFFGLSSAYGKPIALAVVLEETQPPTDAKPQPR